MAKSSTLSPKRKLLTSLLSGEIQTSEFKQQARENGLANRALTLKERVQKHLEFFGPNFLIFLGTAKYSVQEVFDNLERFEKILPSVFTTSIDPVCFDDPNTILFKITHHSIPADEKNRIWENYCERWRLSYISVSPTPNL